MAVEQGGIFIAVDYGRRRIGLARSDPLGMIASSLKTLTVTSQKQAVEKLADVISENNPAGLVFGYPLLPSGDKSDTCIEIDGFIDRLKELYSGPVYRVDEQYSSIEAAEIIQAHGKKSGKRKEAVDRLAAVIILQRFLDERK